MLLYAVSFLVAVVNCQDSSSSSVANYIDANYQAFRGSSFYQELPKELQHQAAADCFDLLRFGDNPVAPIESLAATDGYFPKVSIKRTQHYQFVYSSRFQEPTTPLPNNRYLTLHVTGLAQSYDRDYIQMHVRMTGDSCSNVAFYAEMDQRIFPLQNNLIEFTRAGQISYVLHQIDEDYRQGIRLLIYIPGGCQIRLTEAHRVVESPGDHFLGNEMSLITRHVFTH